jgi:hypothetical protein
MKKTNHADYEAVVKMKGNAQAAPSYTDAELRSLGLRRSSTGMLIEATIVVEELPPANNALVPPPGGPNERPTLAGAKRVRESMSGSSTLSDPPSNGLRNPLPTRPRRSTTSVPAIARAVTMTSLKTTTLLKTTSLAASDQGMQPHAPLQTIRRNEAVIKLLMPTLRGLVPNKRHGQLY